MPLLAGLAVVFAGIAGQSDHRVERQLHSIASDLHVATARLTATELATIGHHGEGARAIVARLHASGVIAGEYVMTNGHAMVRLFIYNGDGGMRSLSEMPLSGAILGPDDLATIRANLTDEIAALSPPAPAVQVAAKASPAPPIVDGGEPADLAPVRPPAPVRAPAPARIATTPTPTPEVAAAPAPHAPPSDAVDVAELEALTRGGPDEATRVDAHAADVAPSEAALHLHATVGLGLGTRSFTPGPTTVPSYASSAVGVVRFAAGIQPTPRVALAGVVERTLAMTSPVNTQMADTSFSRWELTGDYAVVQGRVQVRPLVGLGHRAFAIDSTDPSRSPATDYSYAMLGARAAAAVSGRVTLHGHFTFEPVLGGADPMEMAFGSATRWAVDVGAAVEIRPWTHVYARVAADYQRFTWSWDQVGARGAGGAVDSYPSGTVSLGADY